MLPTPGKVKTVVNHPAVDIDDVSRWFVFLQTREGVAARALTFLTLNASRSQEIRKALWDEISFDTATWMIPVEHMKMKMPHRVPLSNLAMQVLHESPRFAGCPLIFPSPNMAKKA